jgi:uncharacterized Ntn-hydrolase superfamily protein
VLEAPYLEVAMRRLLLALLLVGLAVSPALATFSIVAYDPETGELGVAVQSRVYGVGPRVAWALGGVGAVATQAQANESFGPEGLQLLAAGLSASAACDTLLAHDEGRNLRQLALVDAAGRVSAWTGPGCSHWAGDLQGEHFSCQGNILAREAVVTEMARAFRESAGRELADRLIAALEAGQAAGGDSRGQQSAALLVVRAHPDYPEYAQRYVDVRVEDHATPIAELRRLYTIYEAQGLVQAHLRFAGWRQAAGDLAGARREHERVAALLTRTLARPEADAGTLNALAWFAATQDLHLDEALLAAERAATLEPKDSNILDTLAEVHFRMGHVEAAIAVMTRALELSPEDSYLQGQLARFRAGR